MKKIKSRKRPGPDPLYQIKLDLMSREGAADSLCILDSSIQLAIRALREQADEMKKYIDEKEIK